MYSFRFCPNPLCKLHLRAPFPDWFVPVGFHPTKAFGPIPRFRCKICKKTFSTQTFSLDYYAKRIVDYRDLLSRHGSSESVRALSRNLGVSCGTVLNRFDRLSRQGIALHSHLRSFADPNEPVCVDGFVSFDVSQYFPNEITISTTSHSRFILDVSHATRKRSGTMTQRQKARAAILYPNVVFERAAIGRTFRDILDCLDADRGTRNGWPMILITDEKKEYRQELFKHPLFRNQDGQHRIVHLPIHSELPRTYRNPLFASNYIDREIRKDQANHHRESVCFTRNVSNGMSRLICYLVQHNYRKRFQIKGSVMNDGVHGVAAGIPRTHVEQELKRMFTERAFRTRVCLTNTLKRIWEKSYRTPLKEGAEYLPKYALA